MVEQKWTAPIEPMIKMNVAWKSFKIRQSKEVGAVIRDHTGALMATFCKEFPSSGDEIQMTAIALTKALKFGLEAGFQTLVVEFIDTQVGTLLKSLKECLTEFD